jgi:hypothetical protein
LVILPLLAGLCSCKDKGDECPRRVYPKQESFISDEDLKKYKPYVDVINSMGTFWISEGVTESKLHAWDEINFYCDQRVNNIHGSTVWFRFLIGDAENWKNSSAYSEYTYHEKDGFCFVVSPSYIPDDVQLPATPVISIEEAIQKALQKEPYGEFCLYELCYSDKKLCWQLYGRVDGKYLYAFYDAINGELISWVDLSSSY